MSQYNATIVPTLIAALLLLICGPCRAAFGDAMRDRLENPAHPAGLRAAAARIHAQKSVAQFYQARDFHPVWTINGLPTDAARALVLEIQRSIEEGLEPRDYHDRELRQNIGDVPGQAPQPPRVEHTVDLELLLTDAWFLLASHYMSGRTDPVTIDAQWTPSRRQANLSAILGDALRQDRVVESLQALLPQQQEYARLRDLLGRYRELATGAGWAQIPQGPTIRPGETGPRIAALRQRLNQPASPDGEMLYDELLEIAVRDFQRRHGLEVDGLVGKATLAALNIQPSQRTEQIRANLERWRWMPETLGRRHVRVNIADFRLEAWQEGQVVHSMKVIVGRPYRQTPLFSDNIRYLVFNPAWEVPFSIAVKDKLPQFRKDPGSLRRNGFVLLRGYGAAETEVDPDTVDWASLGKHNFPFRLRQKPGPGNALGRVKIMFPNQHEVYLHDTSNPELFARGVRTFSSGCIRVAQPLALSQWLLSETPGWSSDAVAAAWQRDETKTVLLKEQVPIHLQYATVRVDDRGEAQFLADIYQRDTPLINALQRSGPE